MKNTIFTYFLVCKALSNYDVGGARGAVFQEKIRPGASFKTGDFVKEKFGRATVERLLNGRPRKASHNFFATK